MVCVHSLLATRHSLIGACAGGSIRREAVVQPCPAGALEVVLAAAAAGAARGMRRVPRLRFGVVAQALAVDEAEHDGPLPIARVVLAGADLAGREGAAFRRRGPNLQEL